MKTTLEILEERKLPVVKYYLIGDYLIKEESWKFYMKELIDTDVQLELECNFYEAPMIKGVDGEGVIF